MRWARIASSRPTTTTWRCGRSRAAAGSSASSDVAIVHPETATRCAADEVGEIWVSDPSVARGYWQSRRGDRGHFPRLPGRHGRRAVPAHRRPGLHPRRRALPHQPHQGPDHRRRGEPLSPGHRVDRRGVPPGRPAQRRRGLLDPGRRRGAAGGRRRGRAGLDRGRRTRPRKLIDAIKRAVAAEHEVPVHAVLLLARGSLPKTASGKIQRHGCWRLFEAGGPDVLASWIAGTARLAATRRPSH